MKRSDSVVRYLVRNIIQTAALATIWSIAALVSWFLLKRIVLYTVFDKTSGTVYTHVSVYSGRTAGYLKQNIQAVFGTLISRTQLRDRMVPTSAFVDLVFPTGTFQVQPYFESLNVWPN